jgi:hypothetical protein
MVKLALSSYLSYKTHTLAEKLLITDKSLPALTLSKPEKDPFNMRELRFSNFEASE